MENWKNVPRDKPAIWHVRQVAEMIGKLEGFYLRGSVGGYARNGKYADMTGGHNGECCYCIMAALHCHINNVLEGEEYNAVVKHEPPVITQILWEAGIAD